MDVYGKIFQSRLDSFIKLSINERHSRGIGVLIIDFTEIDTMEIKAYYQTLNSKEFIEFNSELNNYYNQRVTEVPKSMIFFYLFNNNDKTGINIELDLNEKSGYTEHLLKKNNVSKD